MTKKFFESWKSKRSLTKMIDVHYFFEEKGKKYEVYKHTIDVNSLKFEDNNHISVIAKMSVRGYDSNNVYKYLGCETKRIKIHRKDIRTVYYKQVN